MKLRYVHDQSGADALRARSLCSSKSRNDDDRSDVTQAGCVCLTAGDCVESTLLLSLRFQMEAVSHLSCRAVPSEASGQRNC